MAQCHLTLHWSHDICRTITCIVSNGASMPPAASSSPPLGSTYKVREETETAFRLRSARAMSTRALAADLRWRGAIETKGYTAIGRIARVDREWTRRRGSGVINKRSRFIGSKLANISGCNLY